MVKILICGPESSAGGVANHTINLIRSLSNSGYNVTFYKFRGSNIKKVYQRTFGLVASIFFGRNKYDIIHIQSSGRILSFISAIFGVTIGHLVKKNVVVTFHYSDEKFYKQHRSLLNYVIKHSNAFITVSNRNKRLLSKYVDVSLCSKIQVIPNGYDQTLFKPLNRNDCKNELNMDLNSRVLVNVANLLEHKRHIDIIDAVYKIVNDYHIRNIKCYIIGSGPLYSYLSGYVVDHHLEENIILTNWVDSKILPVYLNAADLFLFSSLPDGESFGIVQIEAMGCGTPVIASRNGASEEIITVDVSGLLYRATDSGELAEKIVLGITRKWDRESILSCAEQYQWSKITQDVVSVYNDLILG